MKCLERRITGTEMEYPILASIDGEPLEQIGGEHNRHILRRYLPDEVKQAGQFATNGSRIYIDLAHFFEYATPEDDSFMGTLTNEIAGEQIVQATYENAKADGYLHDFCINKRVLSDDGNTWGYHASFAANRNKITISEEGLGVLGMHLATMSIYAGAGAIWQNSAQGDGARFALSQKLYKLNCESHKYSNAGHEPLLSVRDEPYSGSAKNLSRIHITTMDANMSPWATWMKLGTTSIVLRLMETMDGDKIMNEISLDATPAYAYATAVAADPTLKHAEPGRSGQQLRALDIQRTLYKKALNLVLPPQEVLIMHEWKRALDDLESDPILLGDRADWVIKKRIIERAREQHETDNRKVELTDDLIVRALWLYDLLDPARSLGLKLRQKNSMRQWMPSGADIQGAMKYPPETTRAKLRSEFINEYLNERSISAEWGYVKFDKNADSPVETMQLHPYQTEWDEDINKLMQ